MKVEDHVPETSDRTANHPGDSHPISTALSAGLGCLAVSDGTEDDGQGWGDNQATGGRPMIPSTNEARLEAGLKTRNDFIQLTNPFNFF